MYNGFLFCVNTSCEKGIKAINKARQETIEECADKAKTVQGEEWRKKEILLIIKELK